MARTTIRTEDITDREVSAAKIVEASIGAFELASDSVGTAELANNVAISTSGAITTTGAFTSVGIDDNADAVAITINSGEQVGIATTSPATALQVGATSGTPATAHYPLMLVGGNYVYNAGANLGVYTSNTNAADIGGSINLGGNYTGTSAACDWAQISGRCENGVLGYMSLSTRSSGAETEKVRIDSDGNMKMLGSGSLGITTVASIGDDAVTSFTPSSDRGMIYVGGESTHMGAVGYVCKNGGTTETYLLFASSGTIGIGTGVPTGTTGTDVKFNIFAANDGKLYFENRLGGGFAFWYFTMGLPW